MLTFRSSRTEVSLIFMQQITVQQLAARLAAGEPTLLLDVRQPWEHDATVAGQ